MPKAMSQVHTYNCHVEWRGSTAVGHSRYDREHRGLSPPAEAELRLSGDPAFGGNHPELLNPEQLLLLAASSCQLLSFLATAARARIDVVAYKDEAQAIMPEHDKPLRVTRITLRPHIVVAGDTTEERVRHFVDLAHEGCFIANSVKSEIKIEPRIELR
jgi:organic hydroperoxide reductase OsmC/OhrA